MKAPDSTLHLYNIKGIGLDTATPPRVVTLRLFGPPKTALGCKEFDNNAAEKYVHKWVLTQPTSFYDGIKNQPICREYAYINQNIM